MRMVDLLLGLRAFRKRAQAQVHIKVEVERNLVV